MTIENVSRSFFVIPIILGGDYYCNTVTFFILIN